MKRSIFVPALLFLFAGLHAQQIKKIKISELETYIQQCEHPLVVNFWATFCGPCLRELPYFQTIVEKYKEQHVELLLVSLDLPDYYPAKILSFAKQKKITSSIMWLNETNADYFCPLIDKKWTGGIPSTLFINNKTKYRAFFERQLTEPQMELTIKALVKE